MIGNTVEMMLAQAFYIEEQKRLRRYKAAWEAYNGTWPTPLRKRGTYDDNVIVNKARVIVDKGVSFLFGQEVGFEAEGKDDKKVQTPTEKYLAETWELNKKMTMLQKAAIDGGVCGHVIVKILEPKPDRYPRLVVLDPATVSIRWEDEDIDQVYAYRIQWSTISRETGRPITRRQRIDLQDNGFWRVVDEWARADNNQWNIISDVVWRYKFSPIVDCQNLPLPGSYYGASDIEDDILGLNRSRNFNLSNWNRINRFHASPQTWGKGFSAQTLERAADGVWALPSEKAELHNLEMTEPQESTSELDRRIDEAIHEISRIPPIATGKLDNIGQLSGRALAILYQPLLEKTETKRKLYGDALREINRRILAIGGFGEENKVLNAWPELLPGEPQEEAATYILHEQLGVSKATVLEKMGYDPEAEAKKKAEESEAEAEQAAKMFEQGGGPAAGAYPGRREPADNGRRE